MEQDQIQQKSRESDLPTALKTRKAAGYTCSPTAFADDYDLLMISRRQWVTFLGPVVPIRVIATVKMKYKKLIHFHSAKDSIQ